jgi:hypothetical protein
MYLYYLRGVSQANFIVQVVRRCGNKQQVSIKSIPKLPEPVFVNVEEAQESIPPGWE